MAKFFLFGLVFVILLGAAATPVGALKPPEGTAELYLLPALPDAASLPAQAHPTRAQAHAAAAGYAREGAAPALQALQRLQAQGEVLAYHFDEQALAVRLTLAGPAGAAPQSLRALPGVAQVVTAAELAAFPVSYAQALEAVYRYASLAPIEAPDLPQVTNPSIFVYAQEGNPYSYIRGNTSPNVPVTLSARRGATLLFTKLVAADASGVYRLYPDWVSGAYTFRLLPGDVVTAAADGNTVDMTVVRLTGWIDPADDAMLGYTAPNLTVLAMLRRDVSTDPCVADYQDPYHLGGFSDAAGSFRVSFSALTDVLYGMTGMVEAFDLNGNYTMAEVSGFSLEIYMTRNNAWLYLLPNAPMTVTLKRGEAVIETVTGNANYEGWMYANFAQVFQPGDVVQATSGAATMGLTIAPLTLEADHVSNTLSGTTGANRVVVVEGIQPDPLSYIYYSLPFPLACSEQGACLSALSSAEGAFSLTMPYDLERGDALHFTLRDALGRVQYTQAHVPLVAARPAQREVLGYWMFGNAPVVVEVEDALGESLASLPATTNLYGYYRVFTPVLLPGYRITVRDGSSGDPLTAQTLEMEVAALTVQADSATDAVSGSAPPASLVLIFQDFAPETNTTALTCLPAATAGGAYAFNLAGQGIEAGDEATVYSQGADGHITAGYSHAFQMRVELNGGTLSGYTPLPGVNMTVRLLDGLGAVLESALRTSDEAGTFSHTFAQKPLTAGQRVEVAVVGGATSGISLPPVTMWLNADGNFIYGLSGPDRPGEVSVYQWYSCGGDCARSKVKTFKADAGGNYQVSFAGLTWWDGTPVEVCGQCTSTRMQYYTLEEHQVALYGPDPAPAPADAYEEDDTDLLAKPPVFLSHRTFHDEADQDWVVLEVTTAGVGKTIFIMTTNLGLMEDTVLWLYDDKLDDLASDDDSGPGKGSRLVFTPAKAGTYYVQVLPWDAKENTGNCGATYDLVISTQLSYFPVVHR